MSAELVNLFPFTMDFVIRFELGHSFVPKMMEPLPRHLNPLHKTILTLFAVNSTSLPLRMDVFPMPSLLQILKVNHVLELQSGATHLDCCEGLLVAG